MRSCPWQHLSPVPGTEKSFSVHCHINYFISSLLLPQFCTHVHLDIWFGQHMGCLFCSITRVIFNTYYWASPLFLAPCFALKVQQPVTRWASAATTALWPCQSVYKERAQSHRVGSMLLFVSFSQRDQTRMGNTLEKGNGSRVSC